MPIQRLKRSAAGSSLGAALLRRTASPFSRGFLAIASGTAVVQLLALAAAPALTRIYSPSDFGVFQAYTSILVIGVTVAALRLDLAVQLPVPDRTAARLLACALAVGTAVCALFFAISLAFSRPLTDLIGAPQLAAYLFFAPIGILLASWYQSLAAWATRRRAFARVARTRATQGAALVVAQIAFGVTTGGVLGMLAADTLSRTVGVSTLVKAVRASEWHLFSNITPRRMASTFRKFRRFSSIATASGLLNSAGSSVPPLLCLVFYGPVVAGLLALSSRVIAAPMSLIGQSMSQVYVGEAGHRVRTAPASLEPLFRRTAIYLTAIGVVPALLLMLAGPWIFSVVFGPSWRMAGEYARVLSVMFVFQLTGSALSQTLIVLARPGLQLAWDAFRVVLVLSSMVVVHFMFHKPLATIAAYSISMSVAYIVLLVISAQAVRRASLATIFADGPGGVLEAVATDEVLNELSGGGVQ